MPSPDGGIGTFSASSSGMADAAAALAKTSGSMDAEVNDLEAYVESQLLGHWEGAARQAYWENKRIWDQAFIRMAELTNLAGVTVDNSRHALFNAEGANVRSWQMG